MKQSGESGDVRNDAGMGREAIFCVEHEMAAEATFAYFGSEGLSA